MASPLPIIRSDSAALHPWTMTIHFETLVTPWQGGKQQRSARRSGLVRVEIPYPALTQDQKNTVRAAMASAKGQFATDITLTFGGVTYTHLSLDSDEFVATEKSTLQYDAPLKLSQVISQDLSPGSSGGDFPTLDNGAIGQLPYTQKLIHQTIATKMAAGPKYTYAEFGGGLEGYPETGLKAWEFEEQHLSDVDLAIRRAHFIANWGKLFAFTFTDEDSIANATAHYASDEMVIRYSGPNDASVTTMLEATA